MKNEWLRWTRWWGTAGLAVLGVLFVLAAFGRHSAVGHSPPPPPSAQQQALWSAMGLNDAWYVTHGYTDAPPLSAPSPFSRVPQESNSFFARAAEPITDTPILILSPHTVAFYAYADQPKLLTTTVNISNGGSGELFWVAQLAPSGTFTPTLVPTSGVQGEGLALTVDSSFYSQGTLDITHTRRVTVTASPSDTLNSPQALTVSLYVDPHPPRLWLETNEVAFQTNALSPGIFTHTVEIRNAGGYTMTWHASVISVGVTPLVTPTNGVQDDSLTIAVDSRGYPTATAVYTGQVVVSATWDTAHPYPVLDAPQNILVQLQTILHSSYLPRVERHPTPTPAPTLTPTSRPELAEVRAIWVTRYDWTSVYGSESPEDIDRIVANVAGAGFNTIFFQVRAHGDAYYASSLEPWSARLNDAGVLGQDPGWDPLMRMIEQAHARGIQVHAYVNVYPAWLGTTPPPQNTVPQHIYWTWSYAYTWDDWRQWHRYNGPMLLNSSYLWASPGVDAVRDHVVAVIRDILSRYDVDGVHLDLVRYANSPYSYDPISNSLAGSAKTDQRDQWQRERVTELVSRVYAAIEDMRPEARLSAAVWFCYYSDGCGYGLSSGYAHFYQDSLGWLERGVIDAIAPMLYEWSGFDDLDTWRDVMQQFQSANSGRHVYPGISGDFDHFSEIANRIQSARNAGAAGHAIFAYAAIDEHGYWDDFAAGPYAEPATLAPLTWR